ncbi:MAG: hypothetical protein AAGA33_06380 [Pseudomonadota bacterium]
MGDDLLRFTGNLFGLGWIWTLAYSATSIAIAIIAAVFVYRDAESREQLVLNLHPVWWGAAALVFSVYAVALYWLVHMSNLVKPAEASADE